MNEKRRAKRKKITYYFKVLSANTLDLVGHLTDISTKGISIDSQKPITVGATLHLSIETTPDVSDTEFIYFIAQCRWCKTDDIIPNVYNVGFEILDITAHDTQVIQRIQDTFGTD